MRKSSIFQYVHILRLLEENIELPDLKNTRYYDYIV